MLRDSNSLASVQRRTWSATVGTAWRCRERRGRACPGSYAKKRKTRSVPVVSGSAQSALSRCRVNLGVGHTFYFPIFPVVQKFIFWVDCSVHIFSASDSFYVNFCLEPEFNPDRKSSCRLHSHTGSNLVRTRANGNNSWLRTILRWSLDAFILIPTTFYLHPRLGIDSDNLLCRTETLTLSFQCSSFRVFIKSALRTCRRDIMFHTPVDFWNYHSFACGLGISMGRWMCDLECWTR